MRTRMATAVLAMALAAGCGPSGSRQPVAQGSPAPAPAPPQKSTLDTAIEGFTGKTAVDAGLRARDKIQGVSSQEQERVNEVMRDM